MGLVDDQFDVEAMAKGADESLVTIGLGAPNPMVQMSASEPEGKMRPKFKQYMQKCDRVGTAREPE